MPLSSRAPVLARVALPALCAAIAACGTIDTGSSLAGDGGLPPSSLDAGTVADGGTVGTPDAGGGSGGTPDAGTGGGGNGGGGNGGGGGGGSPDAGTPDAGPTHFTVNVVVSGSGHVNSSPAGLACAPSCSASFSVGATVSLTAAPAPGWHLAGWGGGCSGQGGCTTSSDSTVYAVFQQDPPPPPPQKTVSVSLAGTAGSVSSSPPGIVCPGTCAAKFDAAATVTLTATPGSGSVFTGWSGACSGAGSCQVGASADQSVTATFAAAPPPAQCSGLAPDDVPMQQYQQPPFFGSCGPGQGDANGTLSFLWRNVNESNGDFATRVEFVHTPATFLREQQTWETLNPLQQPVGLSAIGSPGHGPEMTPMKRVFSWDAAGNAAGATPWFRAQNVVSASAPPPRGGVLLAGDLSFQVSGDLMHGAVFYSAGGSSPTIVWGPQPLDSAGVVFAVGVDLQGRSLIITDGSARFGSGHISAQWLGADGVPLTPEFILLSGFVPGPSTWFQTAPLLGGGLAVRRMDANFDIDRYHRSQWLVTVDSGSTTVLPAPGWLASRNNTDVQIARGARGYAVLPERVKGSACSQRVEVVAADGTTCGFRDYGIASGTCDTGQMTLAADGTVIQALPDAMETVTPINTHTCTWRYWPQAVK